MYYLFTDDLYQSGSSLKRFFQRYPVQTLIEAFFMVNRDPDDGHNSFWDALEVRFNGKLGEIEDDIEGLQALDLLSEYFIESVDSLMQGVVNQLGFHHKDQYLYFFDHWLTPTTAVLTHERYETGT